MASSLVHHHLHHHHNNHHHHSHCDESSADTHKLLTEINSQLALFRDMLIHIGQSKDSPELREKIRKTRRSCVEGCKHTSQLLLPQIKRVRINERTNFEEDNQTVESLDDNQPKDDHSPFEENVLFRSINEVIR